MNAIVISAVQRSSLYGYVALVKSFHHGARFDIFTIHFVSFCLVCRCGSRIPQTCLDNIMSTAVGWIENIRRSFEIG